MHIKNDRNKEINIHVHIHTYVHKHNTQNITHANNKTAFAMVTPIYDLFLLKQGEIRAKTKA